MPRYGAVVEVIKTWKFNTFKSRALKFNRIFLPHKKKKSVLHSILKTSGLQIPVSVFRACFQEKKKSKKKKAIHVSNRN